MAGAGNDQYRQLDDAQLTQLLRSDVVIRQVCEYMALMIAAERRNGRPNGCYKATVSGRQVSVAFERHYGTVTLPPEGG